MSNRTDPSSRARRDRLLELTGAPREDEIISPDCYISPDFVRREAAGLWPRVWLMVCREEEILEVGDFVEYTILDQSVVIVRSAPDRVRAFHNVCQHRGRKLVSGSGHISQFRCAFHAWRYSLDGACTEIVDEADYMNLCKEDVALPAVRLEAWQGWLFINLDGKAPPLLEYLAPVPEFLDPLEFGKMRYHWHKATIVPANWKNVIGAFIEGYHIQATHPQNLSYFDDRTVSFRRGLHSSYAPAPDGGSFGAPSPRLKLNAPTDARALIKRYMDTRKVELDAIWTDRHRKAADAIQALPPETPAREVMQRFSALVKEMREAEGVVDPPVSFEHMTKIGVDWHLFPNFVILPNAEGALAYRMRPNGHDPETCQMDIYALLRYPADRPVPRVKRDYFPNWKDGDWGLILMQDFSNMAEVQQGMHSMGFKGLRLNPVQETAIGNFHANLRRYVGDG